jgi:hypothetical protein
MMEVPYNWSGLIQLVKPGFDFVPMNQSVRGVTKDANYDFTAKVKMLTITGEIIIGSLPIQGVTITADNGGGTTVTDKAGKYRIQVPYDWTGTLTPTKEGMDFDPPNKPYEHVTADLDDTLGAKPASSSLPPTQPVSPGMTGPGEPMTTDLTPRPAALPEGGPGAGALTPTSRPLPGTGPGRTPTASTGPGQPLRQGRARPDRGQSILTRSCARRRSRGWRRNSMT